MSLGKLIPIGGSGSGGKKASGASDLTGGLISIGGSKSNGNGGGGGMGDLDMSDFDVDDLLADNTPTKSSKSKTKDKAGASSSPSPSRDSSTKKKSSSSKSKDKDKSSSSKKKSKSKVKDSVLSALGDSVDSGGGNDSTDDWRGGGTSSSSKPTAMSKWHDDDSAEFAPPVKKKGGLDAEFAKMLGLDDDSDGFGSSAAAGDESSVQEQVSALPRDIESLGARDTEITTETSAFSYEPRVRGGARGREKTTDTVSNMFDGGGEKSSYRDPFGATTTTISSSARGISSQDETKREPDNDSSAGDAVKGLSASFFESEGASGTGDDGDAFGSFLTERRSGRGGRRGGTGASATPTIADPFASSASSARGGGSGAETKASALDSLFDSTARSRTSVTTPAISRDSDALEPDAGISGRRSGDGARSDKPAEPQSKTSGSGNDLFAELFPSKSSTSQAKTLATKSTPFSSSSLSSAKDDLLAELFPSEPSAPPSSSSTTKQSPKPPTQPEEQPRESPELSKAPASVSTGSSAKGDLLAELLPSEPAFKPSRRRAADSDVTQHDDLLAELFPAAAPSSSAPPIASVKPERPQAPSSAKASSGRNDISSARDSLLMDLLPESPPKPASVERRRRSITPSTSPVKEQQRDAVLVLDTAAAASPVRRPSLSPQRSPVRTADDTSPTRRTSASSFVAITAPVTGAAPGAMSSSEPPVSPGRAKTLASPSASSIKEVDFEQSKDSLLEELLASPTKPSPAVSPTADAPHRRTSYSLSFEHDDNGNTEAPTATAAPKSLVRQRRQSSGAASVSPSPSPLPEESSSNGNKTKDALPPQQQQQLVSNNPRTLSPAESAVTPALDQHAQQALVHDALAKHEHELRLEFDTAIAVLMATHTRERDELQTTIQALTQQLQDADTQRTMLETTYKATADATMLERTALLEHRAQLERELHDRQQQLHTLQTEHAQCATHRALFASERTGFVAQVEALEAQHRALLLELSAAKQAAQATELAFARFQHETQQAACMQTQREAHAIQTLAQQLETSLVSLTMLQEQVADDAQSKREVETSARLRMITTLESSSRQCAKTTEDECVRLASLLTSLETTLRHSRQEHLEEKERLRQEQLRLNVLATHFQAQSSVLHESAETNTQLLAQYFTASMQDVRVAEARLTTRRQALEDAERALYDERSRFAVYREEFLQEQAREAAVRQREQQQIDRAWRDLQRERDDLDSVIASHEDEFAALQQQSQALEHERERLEHRAQQVAATASKMEAFTRELLAREEQLTRETEAVEQVRLACAAQQQGVASDKYKLDERELRLHHQLKQMEQARRRLNDQRKQHLIGKVAKTSNTHPLAVHDLEQAKQRLLAHTQSMVAGRSSSSGHAAPVDNNRKWRTAPVAPSTTSSSRSNQTQDIRTPVPTTTVAPEWTDPSGLSPSFRQLVEDNWQQQQWNVGRTDAALHKERMWISCIGLDTTPSTTGTSPMTSTRSRAPAARVAPSHTSAASTTPSQRTSTQATAAAPSRSQPLLQSYQAAPAAPPKRRVTIDL